MKLYLKPGACSLSPAPRAGRVRPSPTRPSRSTSRPRGPPAAPTSRKSNPKGYVPALLLDSGELLTEGTAIVQYIADQAPAKKLAPANGSIERYRLQSWLNFIGTELHKSCSPFFNPASGRWKKIAGANLERRLGYIDEQLEGKAYLIGEDFSVADGYLFTVLNWMPFIRIDLSKWSNLSASSNRVAARPAVKAALKAENAPGQPAEPAPMSADEANPVGAPTPRPRRPAGLRPGGAVSQARSQKSAQRAIGPPRVLRVMKPHASATTSHPSLPASGRASGVQALVHRLVQHLAHQQAEQTTQPRRPHCAAAAWAPATA